MNMQDAVGAGRGAKREPLRARVRTRLLGARRLHLVMIALLAVALAIVTVWAVVQRSFEEQRRERVRASTVEQAHRALEVQASELLLLSAQPLAWAFRAEMIAGNQRDIEAYLTKLARHPGLRQVVVFDADGTVSAATNMKLAGEKLAAVAPGAATDGAEPRVIDAGADLRVVVPIMGFDRQIGTVLLDYSKAAIRDKM